jgi:hypothetical protein
VHKKSSFHDPLSSELSADASDTLGLVWGVAKIAELIGRTPRQTYHLLNCGALPAAKIGNRWVTSRESLRHCFAAASRDRSDGAAV